jgi:hypothetical protein
MLFRMLGQICMRRFVSMEELESVVGIGWGGANTATNAEV